MKSFHTQEYADLIQGLIEARKSAGLTQQDVADALGKPQSYVAKIEGCERRLDIAEFVEMRTFDAPRPQHLGDYYPYGLWSHARPTRMGTTFHDIS